MHGSHGLIHPPAGNKASKPMSGPALPMTGGTSKIERQSPRKDVKLTSAGAGITPHGPVSGRLPSMEKPVAIVPPKGDNKFRYNGGSTPENKIESNK